MLKYDRERAFSIRYIFICPLVFTGIAFVIGLDSLVRILDQAQELDVGWILDYVTGTLQQEGIQFVVPVFSALPFSAGFVEEWKTGMVKNVVGRVEKREYLCSKAVTAACVGGTTLVIGVLCYLFFSLLLFGKLETQGLDQNSIQELLMQYIALLVRYFLNGALWAVLGMLLSTWLDHQLMAWLSPFLIYYLLIIFYERYFSWLHILYPREWIAPKQQWPLEQWSICLWLLFLTGIVGYLFYKVGERVLQNV